MGLYLLNQQRTYSPLRDMILIQENCIFVALGARLLLLLIQLTLWEVTP